MYFKIHANELSLQILIKAIPTFMIESSPPVAIHLPSGLNLSVLTGFVWPLYV